MLPSAASSHTSPATRTTNRSPSPQSNTISGGTRESAQPTITANGCWPCAVSARRAASWCGCRLWPATKRWLPASSSSSGDCPAGCCACWGCCGDWLSRALPAFAQAARNRNSVVSTLVCIGTSTREHEAGDAARQRRACVSTASPRQQRARRRDHRRNTGRDRLLRVGPVGRRVQHGHRVLLLQLRQPLGRDGAEPEHAD